jgi:nitrite reductase (NADH) small subunit
LADGEIWRRMGEWVKVIGASELAPGACMEASVEGRPVALHNVDGTFYATGNTCPHRGGPLGQGMLDGPTLMCPWHAWTWDVRTGENTANPTLRIPTYEVRVEAGDVLVRVPD